MQYTGGKARIAQELASVISSFNPRVYWEPFVGAANVIQQVKSPIRIGSDLDIHIIRYLQAVQNGWLPPSQMTREEYGFWKTKQPTTREEFATKAAFGYGASFGGRFFEGFQDATKSNIGDVRKSAEKQRILLQGITFGHCSYIDKIPDGVDLIYCDPPYRNTKQVGSQKHFDSDTFWNWVRACSVTGIKVLISEFAAPDFALEIWSKSIDRALRATHKNKVMTERLFLVSNA